MQLSLAAGLQAVKVINNPALHVKVVNTPIPVHVENGPDPLTIAGTVGAIAAALIASITLFAVLHQIRLANQQIKIANEELDAVKTDLRNNTAQFQEFLRRPKLSLGIRQHGAENLYLGVLSWNLNVQIDVFNKGNRGVRDFMVEVLVPTDALFDMNEVRQQGPLYRTIEGESYAVWTSRNKDHVLFPAFVPLTFGQNFKLKLDGGPWTALYKIYDDFATYPDQGYSEVGLESRPAPVKRIDALEQ